MTPSDQNPDIADNVAPDLADEAPTNQPDPKMLALFVCPVTRTALHYDRERRELVSRAARLAFPIRDGAPIFALDEARVLDH